MARVIEALGEHWEVRAGEHEPHPGIRTLLFFPRNDQRPYRVVEVPAARLRDADALDGLSDEELLELFQHAGIMDHEHGGDADGADTSARVRRLPDVGAE